MDETRNYAGEAFAVTAAALYANSVNERHRDTGAPVGELVSDDIVTAGDSLDVLGWFFIGIVLVSLFWLVIPGSQDYLALATAFLGGVYAALLRSKTHTRRQHRA